MKNTAHDILLIVLGGLIAFAVSIPGMFILFCGIEHQSLVIVAIAYFCVMVLYRDKWMPKSIRECINK